jgi:hypothetical protein
MELIIAIALLGVIILGAASFDIGSRHLLRASETKTQILNEAALILDYLTKDAAQGIGDANNPALSIVPAGGLTFLLIKTDNPTLGNPGQRDADNIDLVVGYARQGNNIIRCRDFVNNPNVREVLTTRAVSPASPAGLDGFILPAAPLPLDNAMHVAVTLRFDPARAQNAYDNPQVRADTDIEVPAQSLH